MSLALLQEKSVRNTATTYNLNVTMPATIVVCDLTYDIDTLKLLDDIENFKKKFPKSMQDYDGDKSNIKAWHSDYKTHLMTDIFDDLIQVKKEKLHKVFNTENKLFDLWINTFTTGTFADRHKHGNYLGYSCVFYPYVEADATPIVIDNNNTNKYESLSIIPKTNMLIIMPPFVFHQVSKVKEDKRISVASNWLTDLSVDRNPFIFQDMKDI